MRQRAFTLIELLVVVAIIALLISILMPSLGAAKKQARMDVCLSNQRQIASAWLLYATDWRDCLPGGAWDWIGPTNPTYNNSTTLCWLGSLNGNGDRQHMPSHGTVYRYLSEQKNIFKCPEDKFENRAQQNSQWTDKPEYSYTAPAVLTGAPIPLLARMRWAESFTGTWNHQTMWDRAMGRGMPWMIVEEDEAFYLAFVTDSGWSNTDAISNRHNGRGIIACVDGSASPLKFQRTPMRFDAWKAYYELSDGRIVSAGEWGTGAPGRADIKLGYMRKARRLNPLP